MNSVPVHYLPGFYIKRVDEFIVPSFNQLYLLRMNNCIDHITVFKMHLVGIYIISDFNIIFPIRCNIQIYLFENPKNIGISLDILIENTLFSFNSLVQSELIK